MLKKILIGLGVLVGLLLVAIIVIPLVVDVDKYRPQIVEAVNQKINGKFELGHLKLSLWGKVQIDAEGLSLKDAGGTEIVKVKDVHFHLPFLSILSGSPVLNFVMKGPEVRVVKAKDGKLNVMTLVKSSPSAAPGGESKKDATVIDSKDKGMTLPAIATRARLGAEIRDARLVYSDQLSGSENEFRNLNLVVRDLSLSRPTELEFWADLDSKMGKSLFVRGPVRANGRFKAEVASGQLDRLSGDMKIDLDKVEVGASDSFVKGKEIPAHASAQFEMTPESLQLKNAQAVFHNAVITISGGMTGLKAPEGQVATPLMTLKMESNEVDLNPWSKLLPSVKDLELTGMAKFTAGAEGPSEKLEYNANLQVKKLTAKMPKLKARPEFNMDVEVATNQIRSLVAVMKAPGNDLRINGQLQNFSKPQVTLKVVSTGMDLDQLLDLPKPSEKKATSAAASVPAGGTAQEGEAVADSDYDAKIAPIREMDIFRAAQGNIDVQIAHVKTYGATISDIRSKMRLANAVASLDQFSLKAFDGVVSADAAVDLKPKRPSYRFKAKVEDFDLKKAIESQLALFKDTVYGKADLTASGSGSSFNPDLAKKNLNARGSLRVEHAKFASIDVGKMLKEGLNNALGKAADKVPALKGKEIKSIPNVASEFESITSSFSIENGMFVAPDFFAKSIVGKSVDIQGATRLGILDYKIDAKWKIKDTYDLTKAKEISANVAGIEIPAILAEGGQTVSIPVTVSGTLSSPQYSYTEVAEYFAKVAADNLTRSAKRQGEDLAKKKAAEAIKEATKNAPPAIKDALKKFKF